MNQKIKSIFFCILSLVILVVSQAISQIIGYIFTIIGLPILESIASAILYPLFTYLGLKLAVNVFMHGSLGDYRIDKPRIHWYWVIVAITLPVFMITVFMILGGSVAMVEGSALDKLTIAVAGVAYYSIAAGIIEEMVFRGGIMGILEKNYNVFTAIIVPSVIFGLVHIIGNTLSIMSAIQLVISGTFVGIMFSLVTYVSGNFWNSALIHALWNMSTIGLFHIGTRVYEYSLYTLMIPSQSVLLTGGDFGIEASIIAVIGYIVVSVFAIMCIKYKKNEVTLRRK